MKIRLLSLVVVGLALPALAGSPPPPLSTSTWTFWGPAPLASGSSAGNVSGRITGVAADPTDANTIYIAAAGGGVWKTSNNGASWAPLTDALPTLSMGAIAVAPARAYFWFGKC